MGGQGGRWGGRGGNGGAGGAVRVDLLFVVAAPSARVLHRHHPALAFAPIHAQGCVPFPRRAVGECFSLFLYGFAVSVGLCERSHSFVSPAARAMSGVNFHLAALATMARSQVFYVKAVPVVGYCPNVSICSAFGFIIHAISFR